MRPVTGFETPGEILGRLAAEHLARQTKATPGTWPRVGVLVFVAVAAVALIQTVWVLERAVNHPGAGMLGQDYDLYMEATARFLRGGPFYLPVQLAGPYDMGWGQILYPPQAIVLFAPFLVLGGPPFVLIPTAITAWIMWSWRPPLWAWGVIAGLCVVFPLWSLPWVAGTPTIWMVAVVALATRWPWMSAFVWMKPSIFPFALAGIRDRRWWIVTGIGILSAVILWPLMVEWVTVVLNSRGENSGLLYSLNPWHHVALVFPLIASFGGSPAGSGSALSSLRLSAPAWARRWLGTR